MTLGRCARWRALGSLFQRLGHERLHSAEQGCIHRREPSLVSLKICTTIRRWGSRLLPLRTCYIGTVLYVVGFVTLGAAFQEHLSIGALVMGWGISGVAVMINTVSMCKHPIAFMPVANNNSLGDL